MNEEFVYSSIEVGDEVVNNYKQVRVYIYVWGKSRGVQCWTIYLRGGEVHVVSTVRLQIDASGVAVSRSPHYMDDLDDMAEPVF